MGHAEVESFLTYQVTQSKVPIVRDDKGGKYRTAAGQSVRYAE